MNVQFWETSSGDCPVVNFIDGLPAKTQEKIMWILELFEQYGTKLIYTKHMKKLKGYDLYELRIKFNNAIYRILLMIVETSSWLLHIFIKKTDYTPQKEIDIALVRRKLQLNQLDISY